MLPVPGNIVKESFDIFRFVWARDRAESEFGAAPLGKTWPERLLAEMQVASNL